MKNKTIALGLLLSLGLLSACNEEAEQAPAAEPKAAAAPEVVAPQPKVVDLMAVPSASGGMVSGPVAEVIEAGGYTYVRVEVNGESLWAAGPPTTVAVGDGIAFSTMIPMKEFHSKSLNRDFPVLYFVDSFSVQSSTAAATAPADPAAIQPAAPTTTAAEPVKVEKVDGGYTIAEALAQKAELVGKPIKVRGQVTKYTPGIMGKNWIHMVDGSGVDDLIVTTSGTAAMGAVVVAEGALSLDRDFGYGYHYEVLMEDAQVTVE